VLEKLAKTRLKDVGPFQSALKELRPQLDHDTIFADFLRAAVVLGYYFNSDENAVESGALPEPVLPRELLATGKSASDFEKAMAPTCPSFRPAAANAGHFNPQTDDDAYRGACPCWWTTKAILRTFFARYRAAVPGMQDAARNNKTTLTLRR